MTLVAAFAVRLFRTCTLLTGNGFVARTSLVTTFDQYVTPKFVCSQHAGSTRAAAKWRVRRSSSSSRIRFSAVALRFSF